VRLALPGQPRCKSLPTGVTEVTEEIFSNLFIITVPDNYCSFLAHGRVLEGTVARKNISGVAVSQFQDAGFEVEALKGRSRGERNSSRRCAGLRFLGVAVEDAHYGAAVLDCGSGIGVGGGHFCIGVDKIDRMAASGSGGLRCFNDPHSK